ncbi:hypothetical protein C0J52_20462, partial [Blattella germanica]
AILVVRNVGKQIRNIFSGVAVIRSVTASKLLNNSFARCTILLVPERTPTDMVRNNVMSMKVNGIRCSLMDWI